MLRTNCGAKNEQVSRPKHGVVHKWFSRSLYVNKRSGPTQLDLNIPTTAAFDLSSAFGSFSTLVPQEPDSLGAWTPLSGIHMPYNNAAIPPSEEITGSASLPCGCAPSLGEQFWLMLVEQWLELSGS